jgi:hypothetical protein
MKKLFKFMRVYMLMMPLSTIVLLVALPSGATAQIAVLEVINAGVKKVIKAVDLKVQRLQNETIWLQNAQKVIENQLSRLKLTEIADWTERQKTLYADYYRKLWEVKTLISGYQRIKALAATQAALVKEYNWAIHLFKADSHFSPQELTQMEEIYQGILSESIKNLDQVLLVVNSFKVQMTDGKRMELIGAAATRIDANYNDLKRFNQQNIILSIQRAKSLSEISALKQMYHVE